ncbi:MAG: hypothetical protein ACOYB4_01280 [Methyloceanibacter sp.]
MSAVGNHSGTRTIGLALAAGLLALMMALMLGVGVVTSPTHPIQVVDEDVDARVMPGGETVISKLAEVEQGVTPQTPAPARLKGLGGEIPWAREEAPKEPTPRPTNVLAQAAAAPNKLPWDAIEPVPFAAPKPGDTVQHKTGSLEPKIESNPKPPSPRVELPPNTEVGAWVKAKATKLKADDRRRPIYHFELWLEPPAEIRKRLVSVAYDFNTPAVLPQSQTSREERTGFRVAVGGLTCADNVTVTLKFDDGRSEQVEIDSCRLLS